MLFIFSFAEPVRFMLANVICWSACIVVFAPELPLLSIVKFPYVCASAFKKIVPAPPAKAPLPPLAPPGACIAPVCVFVVY